MTNSTFKATDKLKQLTLKKLALPLVVAGSMAMVATPVAAKKYRSYNNSHSNQTYDYAKVVSVDPVYETYQVNKPVQHCYDERVRVRDELLVVSLGGLLVTESGKKAVVKLVTSPPWWVRCLVAVLAAM